MIRAAALALALTLPSLAHAETITCDRFGCSKAQLRLTELHLDQHKYNSGRIVGRRPHGCPARYCGCAMSLRIFGRIIPKLNLAANWMGFPRTHAAPDVVAVRRHHVMQLLRHVSGDRWLTYDPNSGHGRTRIHVRSVRGCVFVDPKARHFADAL